jgi:hypothetical protein
MASASEKNEASARRKQSLIHAIQVTDFSSKIAATANLLQTQVDELELYLRDVQKTAPPHHAHVLKEIADQVVDHMRNFSARISPVSAPSSDVRDIFPMDADVASTNISRAGLPLTAEQLFEKMTETFRQQTAAYTQLINRISTVLPKEETKPVASIPPPLLADTPTAAATAAYTKDDALKLQGLGSWYAEALKTNASVLIVGENRSGKVIIVHELLSRYHYSEPVTILTCGSVDEEKARLLRFPRLDGAGVISFTVEALQAFVFSAEARWSKIEDKDKAQRSVVVIHFFGMTLSISEWRELDKLFTRARAVGITIMATTTNCTNSGPVVVNFFDAIGVAYNAPEAMKSRMYSTVFSGLFEQKADFYSVYGACVQKAGSCLFACSEAETRTLRHFRSEIAPIFLHSGPSGSPLSSSE